MRVISLTGFLFAFWLALSGHYTAVLIGAGQGARCSAYLPPAACVSLTRKDTRSISCAGP